MIHRKKPARKAKPKWNSLPQLVAERMAVEPGDRTMITEIVFNYYLPGNNGPNGLRRMSVKAKLALKKRLLDTITLATKNRHCGPVRVEVVRHMVGRRMDYDNLVSTGKMPIDELITAGVITDDNDAVITERDYQQTHALRYVSQFTLIRIIDLPIPEQNK